MRLSHLLAHQCLKMKPTLVTLIFSFPPPSGLFVLCCPALSLSCHPPNISKAFPPLSLFSSVSSSAYLCFQSHLFTVLDTKRTTRKDGMTLPPYKQLPPGVGPPRGIPQLPPPNRHQLGTWHHFLVLTFFQVSVSPQLDA